MAKVVVKSSHTSPAKKTGRPSIFREEYVELARAYTLLGMTLEQIAEKFDVSYTAVCRWMVRFPHFGHAIKNNRHEADARVASALYERAVGYRHPSEQLFYDKESGKVVRAKITKQYAPDTGAAFIWLQNRQPELWKQMQYNKISGTIDINNPAQQLAAARARVNALMLPNSSTLDVATQEG